MIPFRLVDSLIDSIGSACFSQAMFEFTREAVAIQEVFGFCIENDGRMVKLCGFGEDESFAERGEVYVTRFCRHDPLLRGLSAAVESGPVLTSRILAGDIADPHYRRICYTRARLVAKTSFAARREGRTFVLNLYTQLGGRDIRTDKALGVAELALCALKRHADVCDRVPEGCLGRVVARLHAVHPQLSERELDVCARTLIGAHAHEIAVELDLAVSTVMTYRRRAYSRLGISNINQLVPRLLH